MKRDAYIWIWELSRENEKEFRAEMARERRGREMRGMVNGLRV